jgi:hypothetical protein
MFKVLVLQALYNLSDDQTEFQDNRDSALNSDIFAILTQRRWI